MMSMELSPVYKIDPPLWMKEPETRAVMDALDGLCDVPRSLFVGGCVRNLLMSEQVKDIDIATQIAPEEVIARLEKARIKAIPTGLDHGTVTAVINKKSFEITTLRHDVATDGRHADVAYTQDWIEDARRRDFSVNTMLADLEGNIFDPLGGLDDVRNRKIIFVGDAEQRIQEDYLRILRFFRFFGKYGKGKPDAFAIKACQKHAAHIVTLSRERVAQELSMILMLPNAPDLLKLMALHDILPVLVRGESTLAALSAFIRSQDEFDLPDYIARLVCLAERNKKYFSELEEYLVFTREIKKTSDALFKALKDADPRCEKMLRRGLYLHGKSIFLQAILIKNAFSNNNSQIYQMEKIILFANSWSVPKFPLTGSDMLKLGYKQGPEVGKNLGKIERWWIESDFVPSREACMDFAKICAKEQ